MTAKPTIKLRGAEEGMAVASSAVEAEWSVHSSGIEALYTAATTGASRRGRAIFA